MKTNPSEENDPPLTDLLDQWKVETTLPPRFQENVWRRIAQQEAKASLRPSFISWIEVAFKRPALVTSYVTMLLFAGLAGGYWQAHDKVAKVESHDRSLYVQSVDPYQVPRH
jgi:hypothetical protein